MEIIAMTSPSVGKVKFWVVASQHQSSLLPQCGVRLDKNTTDIRTKLAFI